MTVNPLLLSEASIRRAWVQLKTSSRFGSIYLRSGTTGVAGRGLRVFNETSMCVCVCVCVCACACVCNTMYVSDTSLLPGAQCNVQTLVANDTSYVQVCGGSSCNCSTNTIGVSLLCGHRSFV